LQIARKQCWEKQELLILVKKSLNLEQGNAEEINNRTVAMSSLLEERKLPQKGRKDYNKT